MPNVSIADTTTFVDTNVLVYAYDQSEATKQPIAQAVLERLWADRSGVISTQILQELYVTLTRKAGIPVETALSVLDDLSQWLVFSVDCRAIRDAAVIARDRRLSFWDALLVARRAGWAPPYS